MTRIPLILLFVFFLSPQKGFSQDEVSYHNTLAFTLAKKGMLDEATSEWEKVIEINPSLAVPHYNLALAYQKKGMLEEAISEYEKATELNDGLKSAHYNLGNAYYQKGLYKKAYSRWEKVVVLDPNDKPARNNLEVVEGLLKNQENQSSPPRLALKGRRKGHQEEGGTGVPASPSSAREDFDEGVISLKEGNVGEAIKSLKEVVKIDPDFPKAYSELGRAYHKKGMLPQAREAYKKALVLDPSDKRTRFLLKVLN